MTENKQSIELKLVAAFFFVTGVYGAFNSIISFPIVEDLLQILFGGFLIVIFGLTALSGYFIFIENDKGLEYARAIAALQIVHFHIGGIGYYFVTGVYAFVGLINADFGLRFGLDNGMFINVASDPSLFILRINILAIGVFIYISKLLNRLDYESDE